jgi:hypothetical protein
MQLKGLHDLVAAEFLCCDVTGGFVTRLALTTGSDVLNHTICATAQVPSAALAERGTVSSS